MNCFFCFFFPITAPLGSHRHEAKTVSFSEKHKLSWVNGAEPKCAECALITYAIRTILQQSAIRETITSPLLTTGSIIESLERCDGKSGTPASPFLCKSFGGNHAWHALQSHLAWYVKVQLARGKNEAETKWMWCQTLPQAIKGTVLYVQIWWSFILKQQLVKSRICVEVNNQETGKYRGLIRETGPIIISRLYFYYTILQHVHFFPVQYLLLTDIFRGPRTMKRHINLKTWTLQNPIWRVYSKYNVISRLGMWIEPISC